MNSSRLLTCDVCQFDMHKNNWDAHIKGRKHCINLEKSNKRKLVSMSVSDSEDPSNIKDGVKSEMSNTCNTPTMEPDSTGNVSCQVCKVSVFATNWDNHINGKRHKALLADYNKEQKNVAYLESKMADNTSYCEACDMSMHQNNWIGHASSKKHKIQQENYMKERTTVYVTGSSKYSSEYMTRVFSKFGELVSVVTQPRFAFIRFKEESAAEKALFARVFAGGVRLMVHKYVNRYMEKQKLKLLKPDPVATQLSESQVGIPELPVELPNSNLCPQHENVFEWHVQSFVSQVELEASKYDDLKHIIHDVEYELQHNLPGCRVFIFGSCGSSLAFKHSDVDLFVQCVNGQPANFVRKKAQVFRRSPMFAEFCGIPSARVPIVKLRHIQTNFKCDLTCCTKLGVCNSRLIRFLVFLDPRIKPLTMVIKYWAKLYGVTGLNNCFTTYALVMLVIFYLQQLDPPLLPPITKLQRLADHEELASGWVCSFCDEERKVRSEWNVAKNNSTLKELLAGFFQFYRDFDYQNVICPSVGRPVPTEKFKTEEDIPEEMQLYKEKLQSEPDNMKLKFKTNVKILTQDPLELSWNITKNVSDKIFFLFIEACEKSYKVIAENDESSLLASLFSIDKGSFSLSEDPYSQVSIKFLNKGADSELCEQHKLMTEAVLLVMRQVMKATVELHKPKPLSKVQKVKSSQDVHNLEITQSDDEDLVYVCHGNSNVIENRKKGEKQVKSLDLSLNEFEQEVCTSNALQSFNIRKSFYFNLKISSLNRSKHLKSLEITVSGKNLERIGNKKPKKLPTTSFSKEVANFILHSLKPLVKYAMDLIVDIKSSSPDLDVKQSLSELLDSKMAKLPKLNDILQSKADVEKSPSTSGCNKNIIQQQSLLLHSIENHSSKTENLSTSHDLNKEVLEKATIILDTTTSNPLFVKNSIEENLCPLEKETITADSTKHIPAESSIEGQAVGSTFLPKKIISNAKMHSVIDDFFNPNTPDRLVMLPPVECVKDDTIDKFSDMLSSVLKCETKSSFTTEKNPFFSSIEKVQLQQLPVVIKSECNKTKVENKCYKETGTAKVLNGFDKQGYTQLRRVSSNNNESNKRKMDFECMIVQTKGEERSCVLYKHEYLATEENDGISKGFVSEKESQMKPKLFYPRPRLYEDRPPSKYRKPNDHTPQNMCRPYSSRNSYRRFRGEHRQWANPRHRPNTNDYDYHRYYDDDINSIPTCSSFSSQRRLNTYHHPVSSYRRKQWYPSLYQH